MRFRAGEAPAAEQRNYARVAFGQLMAATCKRVSFNAGPVFSTSGISGCAPFETPLSVAGINGFRISDGGAAIYDSIRERCATGAPITLEDESGATLRTLVCNRTLPRRPPWFAIEPT
jgi:hypothetical protein